MPRLLRDGALTQVHLPTILRVRVLDVTTRLAAPPRSGAGVPLASRPDPWTEDKRSMRK